ncbi:hypothetical protein [Streptomyces ardesiacus]|uniref:hypothetical protein n=1 Tax=Streptomyces ardesiacus TaxID=285564 RepID=UPI000D59530A|nr:hypothetical protein [Streptomyces ardesiacus]
MTRAGTAGAPGPLAQFEAVEGLGPDSRVRLRDGLQARQEGRILYTRVGRFECSGDERASVTLVLDGRPRRAGDLGVGLVGRLLRAGVVVPAAP